MRRLIFILSIFIGSIAYAQNLIPNPGFEQVTGCPGASVFLKNVTAWHKIADHKGTPDQFYGDCAYNGLDNSMAPGQKPFDGKGYIGCFAYGSNLREYFTAELLKPMVQDSIYDIEFYVLPASGYGTMINSFGVHFSYREPKGKNDLKVVPLEEHVGNPSERIIHDTVNWTKISGKYKAKGGEYFITFGNFRTDIATKNLMIKENCIRSDRSYMLVDGVSVKPASTILHKPVTHQQPCESIVDSTVFIDERPLTLEKSFTTSKHRIRISIWDDKRLDGDSVHLLLNDSLLLKDYLLTKRQRYVEVALESGEHLLKLVALNLGEIPPNTAAIKITDFSQQRTYVLKSDMLTTEGIRIVVNDE